MKRYFDLHDQRQTAKLEITDGSPAATAPVEDYKKYFGCEDVREVT